MIDFAKIVALLLCLLSAFQTGLFAGFELGANIESNVFSTFGNGYQVLASSYLQIFGLTILFTAGKVLKNDFVSKSICWLSIILYIFPVRNIFLQKKLSLYHENEFTKLMLDTLVLDAFTFSLIAVLVCLLIINKPIRSTGSVTG